MKESIVEILHDYLKNRKRKLGASQSQFRGRLSELQFSKEMVQEILLAMDDEWTEEQISTIRLRKARINFYFGFFLVVLISTVTVLSFLGVFFNGYSHIIFYGGLVASSVAAFSGYFTMKKIQSSKAKRDAIWNSKYSLKNQNPLP